MRSPVLLEMVEISKAQLPTPKKTQQVYNFPDDCFQKLAQQTAQLTTRKNTTNPQRLGLKSTTSLIIFAQQQAKEKIKTSN